MRAAFIEKPGDIYFCDKPEPQIVKEDEVKIRVVVTGICGSEVHAFNGKHPFRVPPVVSGHEFSGVVTEVGSGVTSVTVGQRVTAEPHVGCGECDLCKNGQYHICREKKVLGATYWSGSFGEYIVVKDKMVVTLADSVGFEVGALAEPLSVGMHAVRRSGLDKGKSVLIIGAGPIGLGVLLCAKYFGASTIIVADVMAYNLDIANQMGCTNMINPMEEDVYEKVMALTDGCGVDFVYLAFGSEQTLQNATECTKPGGLISEIAVTSGKTPVTLHHIQIKELMLQGSNMYVLDDFEVVSAAIASGEMDPSPMVTMVMPIEQVTKAMDIACNKTKPHAKILLRFSEN